MYRVVIASLCVAALLFSQDSSTFDFTHWKRHYKLNPTPFHSEAHEAYVDIYLNTLAKTAYIEEKSRFPRGATIYKPLFSDKDAKEFARLVIMVKMQEGYDPQHGDWWYGVYDESGRIAYYQGRIASCIECHKEAKETDYLFSSSVNAEIYRLRLHRKP
jgi:hypothetical protein